MTVQLHDLVPSDLSSVLFERFEMDKSCLVCQDTRFTELHKDYLNESDSIFWQKWTQVFNRKVVENHFRNHCIFSQLAMHLRNERNTLSDLSGQVLDQVDKDAIENSFHGDFKELYRGTLDNLMFIRNNVMKVYRNSIDSEEELEVSKVASKLNVDIARQVTEIEKLFYSKSSQAISNYLNVLKINFFQGIYESVLNYNSHVVKVISDEIGIDRARELLERDITVLTQTLESTWKQLNDQTPALN